MNAPTLAAARVLAPSRALRLGSGNLADLSLVGDVEGGSIFADVLSVLGVGEHFAKKHLGPIKYESFSFLVGPSTSQGLFDWIAGSWGPKPEKKDGAVLSLDYRFEVKEEALFAGALITETTIPALDASSKDLGWLTVQLTPEVIAMQAGSGKVSLAASKQKLWRTSNFRLAIDGLDCTKVSKIGAFTVKRKVTTFAQGGGGIKLIANEALFPNLSVTFAQSSAQSWSDWHQDFVVQGNNGDAFERNGSISFLAADLTTELSRIDLHHLGIVRLARAGSKTTAELYCEEMVLSKGGA